jgi:Lysine-specific metallo-endopeptidase
VLKVQYKSLHSPELLPDGIANPLVETIGTGEKYGALAYVFPINRMDEDEVRGATKAKDLDPLATSSHVGSGMRIYLTDLYFDDKDKTRSATLYHELTHKVLACEDICYGDADCRALATSTRRALRNADSYAMFLLSCNP